MVLAARPSSRPDAAVADPAQVPVLDDALDWELVCAARRRWSAASQVRLGPMPVRNVNRTVGGILSGEIARRHGAEGLPEGTIEISFSGSAGQSFAAWLARGVTLHAARRDQRLRGQGPVGRDRRRAPARARAGSAPRRT